jgi:hypothetical protein
MTIHKHHPSFILPTGRKLPPLAGEGGKRFPIIARPDLPIRIVWRLLQHFPLKSELIIKKGLDISGFWVYY